MNFHIIFKFQETIEGVVKEEKTIRKNEHYETPFEISIPLNTVPSFSNFFCDDAVAFIRYFLCLKLKKRRTQKKEVLLLLSNIYMSNISITSIYQYIPHPNTYNKCPY